MVCIDNQMNYIIHDDKMYGGFSTNNAANDWKELITSSKKTPVTIYDIYLGLVEYDSLFILNEFALGMGMYPWVEIHDIGVKPDNGRLPVYTARNKFFFEQDYVVYADGCVRHEAPSYTDSGFDQFNYRVQDLIVHEIDPYISTFRNNIQYSKTIPNGGQLVVVNMYHGPRYAIAWRKDGRIVLRMHGISGHDTKEGAIEYLNSISDTFVPPTASKNKNRTYDRQKSKLYRWENVFCNNSYINEILSEGDCYDFLHHVYDGIGFSGNRLKLVVSKKNKVTSTCNMFEIRLAYSWGRTRKVILHEVAHHLSRVKFGRNIESHGPEYLGVYMLLLRLFGGVDVDCLEDTASRSKLNFTRLDKLFERVHGD